MKSFYLILVSLLFSVGLKAQDGLEAIILTGTSDASKLTEAYLNPAIKSVIYGMGGGWYHTAKTHKTLGFDITIAANASEIPSEDEIFRFADLGLSSSTTSTSATGATLFGSNLLEAPVQFSGTVQGQTVSANFTMPPGIKEDLPISAIPTPALQVGVGLPFKADVLLRVVPKQTKDNFEGSLYGFGLKKEITSLFGPLEKTPLHVSVLGAYTTLNINYNLQNDSSIAGSNQEATFSLNSYTVQAIASLNFPVINFYGGIGYSGGNSDFNLKGSYNLVYDTGLPAPNNQLTTTVTDPLKLKFDAKGVKTTLGLRLSLGFFKVFADYSFQEYSTATAGIALSFR